MNRYSIPALLTTAVFALFWAYAIIDDLIRVFQKDVTIIDLGVIFILGLICGVALGLIPAIRFLERKSS